MAHVEGDCVDEELVPINSDLSVLQRHDDSLNATRSMVQYLQGSDRV